MFDFPNSPTIGQQIIEPNGAVAQWDGVKWTNVAGQVSSVAPLYNNVGRNLIHNSRFNIWQRGFGPFTTQNYTADRWYISASGGDTVSVNRATFSIGAIQIGDEEATAVLSNTFTGSAATAAYNFLSQPIENVRKLGNKTVTVSFWANANAGNPKLGVSWTQYFGAGGSPSASVSGTGQSVTLSGTYVRYSLTF